MNEGKSIKQYRNSLSEKEAKIISDLSFKNKEIFTLSDVHQYVNNPKNLLYNLTRKNWVKRIKKGVYLIAPLEAGEQGAQSHTVHSFIIASHLVQPYYISHWSALNYHGLTEQTPQVVYVASTKPRNRKTILNTEFIFVTVAERKMFDTEEITVENRKVIISTPEKTIADCLDHPEHCGGIEQVAKALYFEHRRLDLNKVIALADKMGNGAVTKRLGYLLETLNINASTTSIHPKLSKGYSKLDTKLPSTGKINEKWRLVVNARIDPKRWLK